MRPQEDRQAAGRAMHLDGGSLCQLGMTSVITISEDCVEEFQWLSTVPDVELPS